MFSPSSPSFPCLSLDANEPQRNAQSTKAYSCQALAPPLSWVRSSEEVNLFSRVPPCFLVFAFCNHGTHMLPIPRLPYPFPTHSFHLTTFFIALKSKTPSFSYQTQLTSTLESIH